MGKSQRILALRQTLEKRFPGTPSLSSKSSQTPANLLNAEGFFLARGVVTEFISAAGCRGLFLDRMLAVTESAVSFAALIDASRAFDPNSYEREKLRRLLCVFCETPEKAVKAVDLLLRDGNLPLVLLDFQSVPLRNLGRLPASTWHRFQRLAEKSGATLVVLTTQPIIEAARVRMVMRNCWNLSALRRRRRDLLREIELQIFDRSRGITATNEILLRIA